MVSQRTRRQKSPIQHFFLLFSGHHPPFLPYHLDSVEGTICSSSVSLARGHHTHQTDTWLTWPVTLKALLHMMTVLSIPSHTFSFTHVNFFNFALYISSFIKTHQHWNVLLNRADSVFSFPLNQISSSNILFTLCKTEINMNLHSFWVMLYCFRGILQLPTASGIVTTCKGTSRCKLDCTLMLIMLPGDTHDCLLVCGTLQ